MHNWLSNRDMRQLRKLSLVVQSLSGRLNLTEAPLEELRIEPVSQLSQLILAQYALAHSVYTRKPISPAHTHSHRYTTEPPVYSLTVSSSIDVNEFLGSHPHFDRLAYLNLYNVRTILRATHAHIHPS